MATAIAIGPEVTNGAKTIIESGVPYGVIVRLRGVSDMLFHRWNVEEVEAKGNTSGSVTRRLSLVE